VPVTSHQLAGGRPRPNPRVPIINFLRKHF
jgi:hypothetical protein